MERRCKLLTRGHPARAKRTVRNELASEAQDVGSCARRKADALNGRQESETDGKARLALTERPAWQIIYIRF